MQRDYPRLLRAALERLFPDASARAAAKRLLEQYGSDADEPHPERVRLAILKLSGGDITALPAHIEGAKEDHEDTLWWAESPHQTRAALANRSLTSAESDRLAAEDRAEYERWLETHQVT